MTPYRASGVVPDGSARVLLGSTLAVGIVLGALHFAVTRYFDFLLLLYLAVGGGIAFVAWRTIRARKIRAPFLAAALVLSGPVTAWALSEVVLPLASHWRNNGQLLASRSSELGITESEAFRRMVMEELAEAGDEAARARAPHDVPSWIETGIAFITLRTQVGVIVVHHGHANKEGFGMSLVLMLGELFFCCFIVVGAAFDAARTPFCERCEQWYSDPAAWVVGRSSAWGTVAAAVREADTERLLGHGLEARSAERDVLMLEISSCSKCRLAPVHVRLALRNRKWSLRLGRMTGVVPPDVGDRFVAALSGKPA